MRLRDHLSGCTYNGIKIQGAIMFDISGPTIHLNPCPSIPPSLTNIPPPSSSPHPPECHITISHLASQLGQLGLANILPRELGLPRRAPDRRGHGRSDQPWDGNNMDTWSDDLSELVEHLGLKDIMMVGHSTGGGEITRYRGRHGTKRFKKLVLISATTPLLVKTPVSPHGVPIEVFDEFREAMIKDRSTFFYYVPKGPFFGYNRPNATINQSQTDFREELKNLDIPVLVIHEDDDQVVPIDAGGRETIELLKNGTLKVYKGGPHALLNIEADGINKDLWWLYVEVYHSMKSTHINHHDFSPPKAMKQSIDFDTTTIYLCNAIASFDSTIPEASAIRFRRIAQIHPTSINR
ncbi:alpha/beta-hydrolase [Lindgomyces ingoldianus]|uniref:Alpha/beta-hydrolase n=1 Tax=Lindgomyces ingoldianus TaxID=673940 RepID=A0ACB6R5W0_9PLEO|nr:alpha/beta-hydrolase [Lindgomyces ingoldianus]KAF2474218.1 alpha/beta-hydrolase [Lindgomyces ingoldianus]